MAAVKVPTKKLPLGVWSLQGYSKRHLWPIGVIRLTFLLEDEAFALPICCALSACVLTCKIILGLHDDHHCHCIDI